MPFKYKEIQPGEEFLAVTPAGPRLKTAETLLIQVQTYHGNILHETHELPPTLETINYITALNA